MSSEIEKKYARACIKLDDKKSGDQESAKSIQSLKLDDVYEMLKKLYDIPIPDNTQPYRKPWIKGHPLRPDVVDNNAANVAFQNKKNISGYFVVDGDSRTGEHL